MNSAPKFQPGQIVRHQRIGLMRVLEPATPKSGHYYYLYHCKVLEPKKYITCETYEAAEVFLTAMEDPVDILKEML